MYECMHACMYIYMCLIYLKKVCVFTSSTF